MIRSHRITTPTLLRICTGYTCRCNLMHIVTTHTSHGITDCNWGPVPCSQPFIRVLNRANWSITIAFTTLLAKALLLIQNMGFNLLSLLLDLAFIPVVWFKDVPVDLA